MPAFPPQYIYILQSHHAQFTTSVQDNRDRHRQRERKTEETNKLRLSVEEFHLHWINGCEQLSKLVSNWILFLSPVKWAGSQDPQHTYINVPVIRLGLGETSPTKLPVAAVAAGSKLMNPS